MRKTDVFNARITEKYQKSQFPIGIRDLSHISRPAPGIQIQEGNLMHTNRIQIQVQENPRVTLKLVNGLTYQQEMEQKHLVRQMKRADLVFKSLEQPADIMELAKEYGSSRDSQLRIHDLKKEIVKESTKEVHYIVKKHMNEQVNTLTEKVMRRLERTLSDEKKRRGW